MNARPAMMTAGTQPTGWTDDDFPETGNDLPCQIILDHGAMAGFEAGSIPELPHAMIWVR
jgi:inosose dehydratase